MPGFVHQVEVKLAADVAPERLRRIDAWCRDWQIGFRVLDRFPGSETIRIAFEDRRLAGAFVGHFGGALVPDGEVKDAVAGDASDEAAYDRLAREFTD